MFLHVGVAVSALLGLLAVTCQGLLQEESCTGKCFDRFDSSLSCQCNTACTAHSDCCADFEALCHDVQAGGSSITCSSSINDVSEALWSNDVNRLSADMYTLNLQTKVAESNNADRSPAPLFTFVNAAALQSRPTFLALLSLQDNFLPDSGQVDRLTAEDNSEIDKFLDAVLQTQVMHILLTYLQCHHIVSDEAGLRAELKRLWFTPYPRSQHSQTDSSGFEHVMVGEYKSSTVVNGLHNWLAFYNKEWSHEINYYGYVDTKSPDLVAVNYDWNGRHKELGSFFVGTSPEFDMALFTLCSLANTGTVRLHGQTVNIQTYDVTHVSGEQIASAYPVF